MELVADVHLLKRSGRPSLAPVRWALVFPAALLLLMPVAYVVFRHWTFIAIWLFAIGQFVVVCQAVVIVALCGLQSGCMKLRCYGLGVALYGTGSIALTIWFVCLAAFGGLGFGTVELFYSILWLIGVALCIPPAIFLWRLGQRIDAALWEMTPKK